MARANREHHRTIGDMPSCGCTDCAPSDVLEPVTGHDGARRHGSTRSGENLENTYGDTYLDWRPRLRASGE